MTLKAFFFTSFQSLLPLSRPPGSAHALSPAERGDRGQCLRLELLRSENEVNKK